MGFKSYLLRPAPNGRTRCRTSAYSRYEPGRPSAGVARRLSRSARTAAAHQIELAAGVAATVRDGLHEVQAGDLEDRSDDESHKLFMKVYEAWHSGDLRSRVPGGESGLDVIAGTCRSSRTCANSSSATDQATWSSSATVPRSGWSPRLSRQGPGHLRDQQSPREHPDRRTGAPSRWWLGMRAVGNLPGPLPRSRGAPAPTIRWAELPVRPVAFKTGDEIVECLPQKPVGAGTQRRPRGAVGSDRRVPTIPPGGRVEHRDGTADRSGHAVAVPDTHDFRERDARPVLPRGTRLPRQASASASRRVVRAASRLPRSVPRTAGRSADWSHRCGPARPHRASTRPRTRSRRRRARNRRSRPVRSRSGRRRRPPRPRRCRARTQPVDRAVAEPSHRDFPCRPAERAQPVDHRRVHHAGPDRPRAVSASAA